VMLKNFSLGLNVKEVELVVLPGSEVLEILEKENDKASRFFRNEITFY
jgi:hypothetical protein